MHHAFGARRGTDGAAARGARPRTAAAAALALAAGLTAGCAAPVPELDPNAGIDTRTEAPVEASETPELVTNYSAMPWESFNGMPRTDRLKYVDYRLAENAPDHERLLAGEGKPPFADLAADSTPQAIVDRYVYVRDDANLSHEVRADSSAQKFHDAEEAIKLLSGAYHRVGGENLSNIFVADRDDHLAKANEAPYFDDTRLTATGSSGIKSGTLDGETVTYQDIEFFTEEGHDLVGRWIRTEYSGLDGTPKTTWLLDQTFSPERPLGDY